MSPVPGQLYIESRIKKRQKLESTEHEAIPTDPVEFCTQILAFTPTKYQEKFLRDSSQFIALRWSRQSGKSFIVSARLLWQAVLNNGCHIAVVAPSFRQSRLVLRKLTALTIHHPEGLILSPGKTRVE